MHLSKKNKCVYFVLHSVFTIFAFKTNYMQQRYPSQLLDKAVEEFSKLPGIGRKTALRKDSSGKEIFNSSVTARRQ